MATRGYLQILRARWPFLLAGLLLGAGAAAALVMTVAPQYTTETRFFISTSTAGSTNAAYEGNLFSQQRVTSYAELITDQAVTDSVIRDLRLDMDTADLAKRVHASVVPNTVILSVQVTDASPVRAVAIARSFDSAFSEKVRELETPAGSTDSAVEVHVIAEPTLPGRPSAPQPPRDVTFGALLGLLLAAAGVLARDRLDTRIRSSDAAVAQVGAPLLGMTLSARELATDKLLPLSGSSATLESLRRLRTNLEFVDVDEPPKTLVITSAMPAEGKTTLAVNLAAQLAHEGRRVTLVEADLRRPRVTRYLGLIGGAGLTNVLNGSAKLEDVVQFAGECGGNLRVLAAGPIPPDPAALLASRHMRDLLDGLRATSDIVILDAPPVLPVADASGLATLADGVVLCVRWRSTRQGQLRQSRQALERVGARVLGIVTTFVPRSAAAGEGYGYDYYGAVRTSLLRRLVSRKARAEHRENGRVVPVREEALPVVSAVRPRSDVLQP